MSSRYHESPLGPHINQGAKVVHWFHRMLLSLSERKTCDAIVLWILHYRIDSLHLYFFSGRLTLYLLHMLRIAPVKVAHPEG